MLIECPNNREEHTTFEVTAHVAEKWKTDNTGEFLEAVYQCIDVVHYPDEEDYWECCSCGAQAEVKA